MTLLETALHDAGITPAPRYTLDEVAAILGCDLNHVRYLLSRRKLPALKVSQQIWGPIRHEDLDRFLVGLNGGACV